MYGQLNDFSEPPALLVSVPESGNTINERCRAAAEAVGPIIVPGVATNIDSRPEDRNRQWVGSLTLRFDTLENPGYLDCVT